MICESVNRLFVVRPLLLGSTLKRKDYSGWGGRQALAEQVVSAEPGPRPGKYLGPAVSRTSLRF
jgi:hypothetical protein